MRRALLLVAFLPVCPSGRLPAQSLPAVQTAIQLSNEGKADSAKHLLDAELAKTHPGDTAYVQILYWRARVEPPLNNPARDLRRIVVEYGNSPWADDALLQLAQLSMSSGNPAQALDDALRLRSDYPGSDLRARAAFWGGRAAFDVGEPRLACALLDSAHAERAGDIEFGNQVAFYQARCTPELLAGNPPPPPGPSAPAAASPDTSKRPVTPAPPAPAPPPARPAAPARPAPPAARPGYEVQVVAAKTDRAARDMVQRLARSGLHAHIVSDGALHRVRLGPYATRTGADRVAARVRRVAGTAPFVVKTP